MVGRKLGSKRRNRVGPKEMDEIRRFSSALRRMPFHRRYAINRNEHTFVESVMTYLLTKKGLDRVKRNNLPVATLLGKKYIPDLVLAGKENLLAVEFKLLKGKSTDDDFFKAGLAQAAIDRTKYKYVILALVDLTKEKKYRADLRRAKNFNKLLKRLRDNKIEVVTMVPSHEG